MSESLTDDEIAANELAEKEAKTKAVSATWNKARQAESTARDKSLVDKFGTSDLDEILKKIESKPAIIKTEPPSAEIDGYKSEIESLTAKLSDQSKSMNQSLIISQLSTEFSKHNPIKPQSTINDFMSEHKLTLENGLLSVSNKIGEPIFIENQIATLDLIIKGWADKVENQNQFNTKIIDNHMRGNQTPQNQELSPKLLNDPHYKTALKKAGEWDNFLYGKPIDKEKVDRIYNGQLKLA